MRIGRGPRNTTGRPVTEAEHTAVLLVKEARTYLDEIAPQSPIQSFLVPVVPVVPDAVLPDVPGFAPAQVEEARIRLRHHGRTPAIQDVEDALVTDEELNRALVRLQHTPMSPNLRDDIKRLAEGALDRFFRDGRFPRTWDRRWFFVEIEESGANRITINLICTRDPRNA